MNRCADCGAEQPEGALFCGECGRFLLEASQSATTPLPFSQFGRLPKPPPLVSGELEPVEETKKVTFIIPSGRRRLQHELTNEIIVGRADKEAGLQPQLDLTPFQGATHGVSREHASIRLTHQGVVLIDLGSTNGTYLNNYRLAAHQPYRLQDGDEIHFGDLLVHVFFDLN